jgi:hypothetical protein
MVISDSRGRDPVKIAKPPFKPQPWTPADATDSIRRMSLDESLTVIWTRHALDQMSDRELFTGDVLYILKQGFVLDDPLVSTRPGFYKYSMVSRSPNSGSRTVRVVAIPDSERFQMKIVTVMWADER